MAHVLFARTGSFVTNYAENQFRVQDAMPGLQRLDFDLVAGDTTEYLIYGLDEEGNPTTAWEVGVGRTVILPFGDGTVIERVAVAGGSNGGTAVDFSAFYELAMVITPLAARLAAIPPGGLTGQVLAKASDEDYKLQWVNPSPGAP